MQKISVNSNKYYHIYQTLKENIINGKYQGGSFIVESDVCDEFGVSRTPVREALIRLAHARYIEIIPNRGAFIPQITMDDIRELYELRAANDGLAILLFSSRSTPALLDEMERAVANERALLEAHDYHGANREKIRFHSIYVDACGNKRLIESIEMLNGQMMRIMSLAAGPSGYDTMMASVQYHEQVLAALRAGEGETARQLIEAHWWRMYSGYVKRESEGTLPSGL